MSSPPPYPGIPRWVMISALVVAFILLVVVVLAPGIADDHGPSRHGGNSDSTTPAYGRFGPAGLETAAG